MTFTATDPQAHYRPIRDRLMRPARKAEVKQQPPPAPRPKRLKLSTVAIELERPACKVNVKTEDLNYYIFGSKYSWGEPLPNTGRGIRGEVAKKHGLTVAEMISDRKFKHLVAARNEAFYRMRHETTLSLPQIAKIMGDRDHTTVTHGIKRYEKLLAERGEA